MVVVVEVEEEEKEGGEEEEEVEEVVVQVTLIRSKTLFGTMAPAFSSSTRKIGL